MWFEKDRFIIKINNRKIFQGLINELNFEINRSKVSLTILGQLINIKLLEKKVLRTFNKRKKG